MMEDAGRYNRRDDWTVICPYYHSELKWGIYCDDADGADYVKFPSEEEKVKYKNKICRTYGYRRCARARANEKAWCKK